MTDKSRCTDGRPNLVDFHQASAILRAADAMKAEVKEKLGALLAS